MNVELLPKIDSKNRIDGCSKCSSMIYTPFLAVDIACNSGGFTTAHLQIGNQQHHNQRVCMRLQSRQQQRQQGQEPQKEETTRTKVAIR